MAFDLYVQRIRDDSDNQYPRTIAERIFDRGAAYPCRMSSVEYLDGAGKLESRGEIYCGDDEPMIDGFMLTHFGGHTIVQRALEIATTTRSILFWPGSPIFAAATDRDVIVKLPLDVRVSLGEIAVVKTVNEMWAAINFEG